VNVPLFGAGVSALNIMLRPATIKHYRKGYVTHTTRK
jgi:hypothetical protein